MPAGKRPPAARRVHLEDHVMLEPSIARILGVPLDREDAARLWMDTPENPMIVTAVLRLDRPLDFATFAELVETRALARDRLRSRVVSLPVPLLRPRWLDAGKVSVADHVEHVRMPRVPGDDDEDGAGDARLSRVLSRIASEPLDHARPLWRMWLIDGHGTGGGSAIAVRIHHVIADGIALLGVLHGFSDEGAAAVSATAGRSDAPPPRSSGASPRAAAPAHGHHLVARAAELTRLLVRHADAPPPLAGRPHGEKALAWSLPFDVDSLRHAAHRVDAHLNDVVLGALAGAVRTLLARDGSLPTHPVHALVPVALPHAQGALGNQYASLFVRLPVDVPDEIGRVIAARDAMRAARDASGVELGRSLVGAAFALREHVERIGVRVLSRKATLVVSNVAGPPEPLHIAGRTIESILFASPTSGSLALSASAFSYRGALRVTIGADTAVVPDPWAIVRLFEEQMHATLGALLDAAARSA